MGFQYIGLANDLAKKIEKGSFNVGDKLPSLRNMHALTGLSVSTVYSAYIELENRGLVEARQKSGFFVKPPFHRILPLPTMKNPPATPRKVSVNALVEFIMEAIGDPTVLPLGTAIPANELLPVKRLARVMRQAMLRYVRSGDLSYGPPAGWTELRQQIAKRMVMVGGIDGIGAADILVTSGCLEAIQLCLRAVAGPGDTILVESPTFVCYLQLIEDLNMYALEVPADPVSGIDMDSVKKALATTRIRACILNPTFQNPLGFTMPDHAKEEFVNLMSNHHIPIIEDDIYGDLYFGNTRPKTLKSFDEKDMVLYCASASKTLSPDLRIGWTVPGRFMDKVKRLKINSSMATSKFNQLVVVDFLKEGYYDRHLRQLCRAVKAQMVNTAQAVARHFPANTKITTPEGGLVLWGNWTGAWTAWPSLNRRSMKKFSSRREPSAPARGSTKTASGSVAATRGMTRWLRA